MGAEETNVSYRIIVKSPSAQRIIEGLADLQAIEVIEEPSAELEVLPSIKDLYGSVSREAAEDMLRHVGKMRDEWDRDLNLPS